MPSNMLFPTPVFVICTYDADGKPNAATFAWGGIASSGPPCVSVAVRPERHTFAALTEKRAFTLNLVPQQYAAEADYFGIVSGRGADKFAVTGLTAAKSQTVNAPYVTEFGYALECEVVNQIDLGVHHLFIGEVKGNFQSDAFDPALVLTFDPFARAYRAPGGIIAEKPFDSGRKFK